MIWASLGFAGGSIGALLDRLGGLLGRLEAILGPSEAVMEASWTILAALVACQVRLGGHLGRFWTPWRAPGSRQAAQEYSGGGGCTQRDALTGCGPLRRLQKPCQAALGILPRFNVPGGTVADPENRQRQ